MKRLCAVFLSAGMIAASLLGCAESAQGVSPSPSAEVLPSAESNPELKRNDNTSGLYPDAVNITLSDSGITVDGEPVSADPDSAVYAANDIVFYLAGQDFTYGEGEKKDEHEQSEADRHTVLHIAEPGKYILSGTLSAGQIAVDLGEDAEDDPNSVVTLILDGIDITCSVAPAVIFYNVYECGDSDQDTASHEVDTSAAGANVIIADDSINNVNGSYVARIYKSYTLSEDGTEVVDSKKLHKYDAAFYSKMSMNVNGSVKGSGVLNITAENEGLDSELHLTVNGGNIYIKSGDDGINTNEDYVSVTTINGGLVDIVVNGGMGEGDGIDSNGWIVINGGTVIASACPSSGDAGLDSDMGVYINGGNVCATGNMIDGINSTGPYAVFAFDEKQNSGKTYILKDTAGNTVGEWTPANDFRYLLISGYDIDEGIYTLWNGETQYAGVAGTAGLGKTPGGIRPDADGFSPPEDFDPAVMPPPEIHEEGMGLPADHVVGDFPDRMPPEGRHSSRVNRGEQTGGLSLDPQFLINRGGSIFSNVSPLKTTS